jgi:cystathionine gamma-synthase
MICGYPRYVIHSFDRHNLILKNHARFFVHPIIQSFADILAKNHGLPDDQAMLFTSAGGARRALSFVQHLVHREDKSRIYVLDFVHNPKLPETAVTPWISFSALFFPSHCFPYAKQFWQHTGEGVQSRRAEYCRQEYEQGALVEKSAAEEFLRQSKGPKRYRKAVTSLDGATPDSLTTTNGNTDYNRFLEERFGRNLNLDKSAEAKAAIRRRIAGSLTKDTELHQAMTLSPDHSRMRSVPGFSVNDIYLYSCGMNSIYTTHRNVLLARGPKKSICYGFPYIDTLKVLEKFGPGVDFYGFGTPEDLDDLEKRLENGERFLSLFCEFPSNPLLRSPDLKRIKQLADKYDFAIVVDETVGNFLNVSVLPYADVVVSSLTKVFSGDSNVMGGAAILNPTGRYYDMLKRTWNKEYEDHMWPEDAIFLERNSRDYVQRIERINGNAEALCTLLQEHPKVKAVYYPQVVPSRPFYDACRTPTGGYGGLLSATFHTDEDVIAFYDNLDTEKGPSLGTNFTLASPYTLLAHFTELDWAEKYGAEKRLIRFSVGLEDTETLLSTVKVALAAIKQ